MMVGSTPTIIHSGVTKMKLYGIIIEEHVHYEIDEISTYKEIFKTKQEAEEKIEELRKKYLPSCEYDIKLFEAELNDS